MSQEIANTLLQKPEVIFITDRLNILSDYIQKIKTLEDADLYSAKTGFLNIAQNIKGIKTKDRDITEIILDVEKIISKKNEIPFLVPAICPGAMIKISGLVCKMDLPSQEYLDRLQNEKRIKQIAGDVDKYAQSMIECIVMGIENKDEPPSKEMVDFLRKNCEGTQELLKIFILIIRQLDYSSFLALMESIQGINLFRENSIPGGLSVPQSNTLDGQNITSSGK